jgi:hypothetical protein
VATAFGRAVRAAFVAGAAIGAAPLAAQDMGWSTITPSITGTDTLGLVLREQMDRSDRTAAPRDRATPRTSPAAPAASPASFDFQPSPERRRANIAAFVARARQRSPKAAEEFTAAFGGTDMIAQVGDVMAPLGLKTSNVADAMAVYWIVAWQAGQGHNNDFDRATALAVRTQVTQGLSGARILAGASDAAKQEFAETLLIQAILTDGAVTACKGDRRMLDLVAQGARRNAGAMGINLAAMRLTPAGFVPAR